MKKKDTEPDKLLTGRAKFEIHRNDMFWNACIYDTAHNEFFHLKWTGYNDSYWWDNVSEKNKILECTGDNGTKKTFKLNYNTLDVEEIRNEK